MTLVRSVSLLVVPVIIAVAAVYTLNRNADSVGVMSTNYFSSDYFTARSRFRQKVETAGGQLKALEVDVEGPGREDLTIDIA